MINILFAAVTERWDQYEKPLKKQLNLLSLKYKLAENLPPDEVDYIIYCLLYTSPSPRDRQKSRMPSSA